MQERDLIHSNEKSKPQHALGKRENREHECNFRSHLQGNLPRPAAVQKLIGVFGALILRERPADAGDT